MSFPLKAAYDPHQPLLRTRCGGLVIGPASGKPGNIVVTVNGPTSRNGIRVGGSIAGTETAD